ncbi:uncharacterized protein [Antedon mediterranea]|uniref:uncharacterized protein n=1 Tax=Antedon mediterranea TaxID=105859 RepID=UPI003AF5145C
MNSSRSNSRPLGSVKMNRGIIFPPLTRLGNESGRNSLTQNRLSIQGDGMVTHQRVPEKDETPRTPSSSSRPHTSRSEPNQKLQDDLREYQNRERQHKNRIQSLQKLNEQFKSEIAEKQEELDALRIKLNESVSQEEHYRVLYEKEKKTHQTTKLELEKAKLSVTEKAKSIVELKSLHELNLNEMNAKYKTELNELETSKNKEISDREDKIKKLKLQMGSILKDNSWERQQQLEELTKELNKISEEANILRTKLKNHICKAKGSCENCFTYKKSLELKNKKLEEQEKTVLHLMSLVKKFETQLMQQDMMLKEFAMKKGFKSNYLPK